MERAYSVLEMKSMDDSGGKRTFSGIATTPSPDREGDIVEPKGMIWGRDAHLLWQHNARDPIGWVRSAKVSDKGIEIQGEVATVQDTGRLKERLDEYWQMLKAGLVRGLSEGFRSIESTRIDQTYSRRFVKTVLLDLSCVTIPANSEANITTIRSLDRKSASGRFPIVRLDGPALTTKNATSPGVSGKRIVYLDSKP